MAKVIDIQKGTIVADGSGVVDIKFDPPFSEGYVLEFFSLAYPILIRVLERDNLHWRGQIWCGNSPVSLPTNNHTHTITLSACAAGHADCVAGSPSGGPSETTYRNTNYINFGETFSWIAIGV